MLLTHYLALPPSWRVLYALRRFRGPALAPAAAHCLRGSRVRGHVGQFLFDQFAGIADEISAAREPREGNFKLSLRRLSLLPLRYFTEPMKKSRAIGQVASVMYVLPLVLLWKRRDLLLWCLLGGCVIFWVFASDLIRPARPGVPELKSSRPGVYAWRRDAVEHAGRSAASSPPCRDRVRRAREPYSISSRHAQLAQFLRAPATRRSAGNHAPMGDVDWQGRAVLGLATTAAALPIVILRDPPGADAERRIARRRLMAHARVALDPIDDVFPGSEMLERIFP